MSRKKKNGIKITISYVGIAIIALIMILPLIWLFSASFQNQAEIYKVPFSWIPEVFRFENYADAWTRGHLNTAFISSACVSIIYIVCHICFCTIIGYVFAKYNFKGKSICFALVLGTLMIPQELTYFPVYGIIKELGLINTYAGVALPLMISGMGVFMMRQFALYIPNEILEAARIDGCGNFRSFISVGVPLLKPGMASLTILAFSFIWDEFAWSRLMLNTPEKMTIPITLTNLISSSTNEVQITAMLAASVIALIPVLVLFIVFQRQFIESITQSGVKG